MHAYFVHFIRYGDPNGDGLPQWPIFATGERMTLDVEPRAEPDRASPRGKLLDRLVAPATAAR
jgi:para-nitrobenzyl esterase